MSYSALMTLWLQSYLPFMKGLKGSLKGKLRFWSPWLPDKFHMDDRGAARYVGWISWHFLCTDSSVRPESLMVGM